MRLFHIKLLHYILFRTSLHISPFRLSLTLHRSAIKKIVPFLALLFHIFPYHMPHEISRSVRTSIVDLLYTCAPTALLYGISYIWEFCSRQWVESLFLLFPLNGWTWSSSSTTRHYLETAVKESFRILYSLALELQFCTFTRIVCGGDLE